VGLHRGHRAVVLGQARWGRSGVVRPGRCRGGSRR